MVNSCEVFTPMMLYDNVSTTGCPPDISLVLHSTNWLLSDEDSEGRQHRSTALLPTPWGRLGETQ
jgi:hypothetical protein